MNEVLKNIQERTSCRSYKSEMIKTEELEAILTAGIQAPSAMNRQLCEVYAITNANLINQLNDALLTVFKARNEAKDNYHCSYHAPVFVIVSGPEYDSRRVEDGSCMLENMFLAASSLNIGSCWINQLRDTQNVDEVRTVLTQLGIPANHQVVGCVCLGYPDQVSSIKNKKTERIHIVK